eukprot:2501422-Rhodomonas_salina.1
MLFKAGTGGYSSTLRRSERQRQSQRQSRKRNPEAHRFHPGPERPSSPLTLFRWPFPLLCSMLLGHQQRAVPSVGSLKTAAETHNDSAESSKKKQKTGGGGGGGVQ